MGGGVTCWFVSRHSGAREWASRQGIPVDCWVEHLAPEQVKAGDVVYGTLPIPLVALINGRGARYIHLVLDLSASIRGKELSPEEMEAGGAKFQEYKVIKV
ncbi:CRISPR-associated protein Csx16 [Marinobacter sp.]|uniref:CRISPR-associated protein Csx16 n=1 Tax=Marinobacter sp. TaxID=50741 RepID=UPI0035623A76